MEALKYKVIKSKTQYQEYCNQLAELVDTQNKTRLIKEEIELLNVLIEKWDEEHNTVTDSDPVELLRALMEERHLKATHLVEILGVSKGLVSDILSYKKGMSKDVIRTLSGYFKVSQEAFNRPYKLVLHVYSDLKNARTIGTGRVHVGKRLSKKLAGRKTEISPKPSPTRS